MKYLRRTGFFGALVFASITLVSCLSVETHVQMRTASRIRVDVTYTVDTELWNLGVFDGDTPNRTIPFTRSDAERIAYETGGKLVRYRLSSDGGDSVIEARFRVPGIDSLKMLLGDDFSLGENHFDFLLSPGIPDMTPEQESFFRARLAGRTLSLTFDLPGTVVEVSPAGSSSGSSAELILPMEEVLLRTEPFIWTVSWE